ncbi:MAG: glycosyltransferase family 2 protein [Candidatus Doudnabacteria bacterium]
MPGNTTSIKKTPLVRFLEIFPGVLTWTTLLGAPVLAYFHPVWISVYIILFDLFWFLKGANVALHLLHSYNELKTHNQIDWFDWINRLKNPETFKAYLSQALITDPRNSLRGLYRQQIECLDGLPSDRNFDFTRIYHMVILATFNENFELLDSSISSYAGARYDHSKIIFVLATEERAGTEAEQKAKKLFEKYQNSFHKFVISKHPDGVVGEAKVKGANITHAAKLGQKFIDETNISYEDVIVSAFDSDTTISKNYFAHLTYDFLTAAKPLQSSYQPMPMFHNNIWDSPAVARVIASSSSFWQLVEASRPDRLITFSSHAMSFKTLVDVGFWRTDIIPDDSHIFWQCFLHFNGDYRSKPLFSTVSMDAVLASTYTGTLLALYKQKRRWAWGCTEIPMVIPEFIKNHKIPLWKKLLWGERLVEGHYFWATASIMIAVLGWLPLIFGGERFGTTVLALNLPQLTRGIMTIATFFLIFSMYVSLVLLPPRPKEYSRWKSFSMVWQWILSPIVSSLFGSLPAIDAQTRMMLGKYMEFFVTPKVRKHEVPLTEKI